MKIKNIFKKASKTAAKVKVQKLDKTQLEKVAGGVETGGDWITNTCTIRVSK